MIDTTSGDLILSSEMLFRVPPPNRRNVAVVSSLVPWIFSGSTNHSTAAPCWPTGFPSSRSGALIMAGKERRSGV